MATGDIFKSGYYQNTEFDGNHNKFWNFVAREAAGGMLSIEFHWGRVGGKIGPKGYEGQKKVIEMTPSQLEKKIAGQVKPRDRGGDGYVEIDHTPTSVTKSAVVVPTLSGPVAPYIQNIFAAARENIKTYLTVAVADMSLAQVNQGRAQLALVSDLYDQWQSSKSKNTGKELTGAVERYYNLIPTKLPHKIDAEQVVIDLCADFGLQEDRLSQLEAATQSQTVVVNGAQEINFGAELEILPESDPTYERLVRYMKNTDRGHAPLIVKKILKARLPLERAAYEACPLGTVWELFHGTEAQYARHILGTKTTQGLIVPRHAPNGRAFGDGIYFANVSTKSVQYASGYNGFGYMFIVNVKVGRPFVPDRGARDLKPPTGYDSIHAVAGKTRKLGGWMDNDEIIVYRPDQQSIQYVVVLAR